MRNRNKSVALPRDESYLEWLRYLTQSSPLNAGDLPIFVGAWAYAMQNAGKLSPEMQALIMPFIEEARIYIEATLIPPDRLEDDMTNIVFMATRLPAPGYDPKGAA